MSEKIRLIPAPLNICYSIADQNCEAYEREYQLLSESDDDPIGQWLKIAKAKGETKDSDPVLLNLLVELHRKVDELAQLVKNETPQRVELSNSTEIESIGFEHFQLKEPKLKVDQLYYGRIEMPIFPKRDVPVWFIALDERTAKIKRLHERDEKEWNSYVTARERAMIREMKRS
jgi:hypothetical protein